MLNVLPTCVVSSFSTHAFGLAATGLASAPFAALDSRPLSLSISRNSAWSMPHELLRSSSSFGSTAGSPSFWGGGVRTKNADSAFGATRTSLMSANGGHSFESRRGLPPSWT
jgi:hypothetical protein